MESPRSIYDTSRGRRERDRPGMRRNRRIGIATRSDVVPLHVSKTPEEATTTTTDHFLGIGVHKTDAYVAIMDEEGKIVDETRVANTDLGEIGQEYEGRRAE